MAASDLPAEAVEAALYGKLRPIVDAHLDHFEAITRADERARVLAEVDAALDRMPYGPHGLLRAQDIKEILADTLGAGGDGEGE